MRYRYQDLPELVVRRFQGGKTWFIRRAGMADCNQVIGMPIDW